MSTTEYIIKYHKNTNYAYVQYWTKIRRTKIFGGQKCRKFEMVPKILSAEKFCPPKVLSAEFF